jgi:hypothetical protein
VARFLVGVGHRDAADVEGLAAKVAAGLVEVDPAEAQRGVAHIELTEAGGDVVPDGVALHTGLLGAASTDLHHSLQLERTRPAGLERSSRSIEIRLLGGQIRVVHGGINGIWSWVGWVGDCTR